MKRDSYLYGKFIEIPEIPADIIMRRVELLNDNLSELLAVPHLKRDTVRVNAILKAIDFWERMSYTN